MARKTPLERAFALRTQAEWLSAEGEAERVRAHIKKKSAFDALNQARELVERLETLYSWTEETECSDAGEQLAAQTLADDSKGGK
jgi:hypothetical protein